MDDFPIFVLLWIVGFIVQTIVDFVFCKFPLPEKLHQREKLSETICMCEVTLPAAIFFIWSYIVCCRELDIDTVLRYIFWFIFYVAMYIAFCVIAFLLAAYLSEDQSNGEADRTKEPLVDDELWEKIYKYILDPKNKAAVDEEVGKALSEMKYQKWDLSNVGIDRKVAILLVNRGRLPKMMAYDGEDTFTDVVLNGEPVYHSSWISEKIFNGAADYDDIMEQYGFMLWIDETFTKQKLGKPIVVMRFSPDSRLNYLCMFSEAFERYEKNNKIARKYGQETTDFIFLRAYTPKRADPPKPSIPKPYYK